MKAAVYQKRLKKKLCEALGPGCQVESEWPTKKNAIDGFGIVGRYAPRLDLAVGPWNTTQDVDRNVQAIREASDNELIAWIRNGTNANENKNPRCLLAIEIEFTTSSKHILGGFTNASMMGAIGLIIGQRENMPKIRRIEEYVKWLRQVGKSDIEMFGNVTVFEANEFLQKLDARRRG